MTTYGSTQITDDPLVHVLAWLKQRYGILVSDCESTTNWTNYVSGAMSISTDSVVTDPADDNYKEEGSYVIKCTGTADGSGNFVVKYTPTSSINFSGKSVDEFGTGWLTYFSIWIKTTQAGTFRITLIDSAARTAYWNITVTAGYQGYKHNILGTYTSSDVGFDLTQISEIRIGYIGMTAAAAATFRVDGLRVQGDPTFNYWDWFSTPGDKQMTEHVIAVALADSRVGRLFGIRPQRSDAPIRFGMGPQPTILTRRPIDIGYQLMADIASNKSEGLIRFYRSRIYHELYRILRKYNRDLISKGIDYIQYEDHTSDNDFQHRPGRARGFFATRVFIWTNTHGDAS